MCSRRAARSPRCGRRCGLKPEVWQTVWVDAALVAARADRVDHTWHGRLSRYVSDLATRRRKNLLALPQKPSRIPRRLLQPPECLDIPNRIVTGADLPLVGSSAAKPAAPRAEGAAPKKMLSRISDYRRDRRELARERFAAAAARRAAETRASSSSRTSRGAPLTVSVLDAFASRCAHAPPSPRFAARAPDTSPPCFCAVASSPASVTSRARAAAAMRFAPSPRRAPPSRRTRTPPPRCVSRRRLGARLRRGSRRARGQSATSARSARSSTRCGMRRSVASMCTLRTRGPQRTRSSAAASCGVTMARTFRKPPVWGTSGVLCDSQF